MSQTAVIFVVVVLVLIAAAGVVRTILRGDGFGLKQLKTLLPLVLGMLFLAVAILLMGSGSAIHDSGLADKTPFEILKSFFM